MSKLKLAYMWFEWKMALIFREDMKQRYLNAISGRKE